LACRRSKQVGFGSVVHGVVSCGSGNFSKAGSCDQPCMAVKPSAYIRWIEEKVRSKTPNLIVKQQGSGVKNVDAPYHVSVRAQYSNKKDYQIVGQGAILSKRWVLTAASCVDDNPLQHTKGTEREKLAQQRAMMILQGEQFVRREDPEILHRIMVRKSKQFEFSAKWYQHEDYQKNNDKYDKHNVALIFLERDLNFEVDYVKPIRIVSENHATDCKVFGWEYNYKTNPYVYENSLQVRNVEILDDKRCSSPVLKPKALQLFYGHHICTEQEKGRPTISVEAGTSLICKDNLHEDYGVFGVASFGGYWERVGGGAGPKVFTRIQPNTGWIMDKQEEIERINGLRQ